MVAVLWGVVISIALYPIFEKSRSVLGGRHKAAGALFIVVSLALVITPTYLLGDSLVSINASYQVDLWGRINRSNEAALASLLAPTGAFGEILKK